MPMDDKFVASTIESLIEEIKRLQKAHDLLERVYVEIGPYPVIDHENGPSVGIRMGTIHYLDEPWSEVRDFFNFNDSE